VQGTYAVLSSNQTLSLIFKMSPLYLNFLIFPNDLPSLPRQRKVDFEIHLIANANPISKEPYYMAPAKLKQSKFQLKELLEKGFIKPRVSHWGAPVLFVKQKEGSLHLCIDHHYQE